MAIQSTNSLNTQQTVAGIFNPPVSTQRGADARQAQSQSNNGYGGEQKRQQEALIRHSSQGIQKLEEQRSGNFEEFLAAEGVDQRGARAVNAYQSLANLDQRQEIQTMLGVDVYV